MYYFVHPGGGKILYYAPTKEKSPKARVANKRYGLANLTPVERILFFTISGSKKPHSCF